MTQRKFRDTTRGGYWVRNVEPRETDGEYTLQAEIGNHSGQPPSDDPRDWQMETFKASGVYFMYANQSPFDLIEVKQ